jgi:hypothetical protein
MGVKTFGRAVRECSERAAPSRGWLMAGPVRAIETTGTVDKEHRLHLDEPIPVAGPSRVRVIILVPEEADEDEREWLRAAATNPAFDFLKPPEEDIYTTADGEPFRDQG